MLDYTAPLPDLLNSWRMARGWTQEAAAQALRVPVATWRNWEQGHRAPHPDGPLRLLLERLDHP